MINIKDVEADIVDTCNFRCVDCSHAAPSFRRSSYTIDQFEKDIEALSKVLHTFQFTLLGGEPLLVGVHMPRYVYAIRYNKLADTVRLVTNGTLLPRWEKFIDQFNTICVSIYPTEKSQKVKEWIEAKQYPNIFMWKVDEFGEFYTPETLSDAEAQASWDQCYSKDNCNSVYKGKYYKCAGAAKFSHKSEGVDLHAPDLESRLKAYIENNQRIASCSHCYGGRKKHPWMEHLSGTRDIYIHEQASS
jgi:organic radical activating enzyme